jgi:four helix bundle protein
MTRIELENRLITFAGNVRKAFISSGQKWYNHHLMDQLLRSTSSAALNYAEAQAAESKRDFIHKLSICLKELKESEVCIKLLNLEQDDRNQFITDLLKECGELIRIFSKTLVTLNNKIQK